MSQLLGASIVEKWREAIADAEMETTGLLPVRVVDDPSRPQSPPRSGSQPVLVSPGGWRIEGLALPDLLAPLQFIVVKIVTNVWGIAQHARLVGRLGPLDGILATPSNHRVHHGVDAIYLDRNYGEVLIAWDRLFGT